MKSRKALTIGIILMILPLTFYSVPSSKAQIEGVTKGQWVQENKFGFPVWIAANYVIHAPAMSHRHIYLFIEAANFNERNLRRAFTSLAEEFKNPGDLFMYAYSDRAALQKALAQATSGILCVTFGDSPEGRRASRNYSIKTESRRAGLYYADYYRFPDGREQFTYNPNMQQEHRKTVDLKHPVFTYSGNRNEDLVSASAQGDIEAVKLLLEQDSAQELIKQAGDKALLKAAWNGQAEIVSVLLSAGVVAKGEGGNAALLAASYDGSAEIVQALLDRGADVHARNGRDKNELDDSALMVAALHGHKEVVEALLAKGAKLDDRNRFGETALMQAALAGFPEIVRLLAAKGADVNAQDTEGKTALMLAQDDRETVETLLGLGADYKVADKEGATPLMLAVRFREAAKQDTLIAKGAGKESIEAAKRYITAPPPPRKGMPLEYEKEDGYRVLMGLYLKLGMKKEAVETGKQMLEVLGDKAHLRGQLGFMYLTIGDRDAAMAQYKILTQRADEAQDIDTKQLYQGWSDALWKELNK